MKKTKVIAFANNKGGSGKTTTVSNVAAVMASFGRRVLAVDGDMQVNLSLSYFNENQVFDFAAGDNLYTAVKNGVGTNFEKFIVKTKYDGLDLFPASPLLSTVELELYPRKNREFVLKECLAPAIKSGEYDYVLIDAPPTLGVWVTNILAASDFVVVPLEASPWGLFGLANMFDFINETKKLNPTLEILGIALTKADERKNYFKDTLDILGGNEAARLFKTYIKVDSAIEWAQDNSEPVVAYKRYSRSALGYQKLAKEIMEYADR